MPSFGAWLAINVLPHLHFNARIPYPLYYRVRTVETWTERRRFRALGICMGGRVSRFWHVELRFFMQFCLTGGPASVFLDFPQYFLHWLQSRQRLGQVSW